MGWLAVGLWIIRALLGTLFAFSSFMRRSRSPKQMAGMGWSWAEDLPLGLTRFAGMMEMLGAIGIVLPMLTCIAPGLTLVATGGFVLLQTCAIALHASRGEAASTLWFNLLLLVASLFMLWGRWGT